MERVRTRIDLEMMENLPSNNRFISVISTRLTCLGKRDLPCFRLGFKEEEEKEKMWRKWLLKKVSLRRVLYPTGSMQQLLNGRAVLADLYTQGRRFAPVRGGKKSLPFTIFKPIAAAIIERLC